MIETFSDADKLLVRYLYRELKQDEATQLEDEMLLDDELAERAEVVEMNLIDGYVRGELSAAERLRFEERFLVDSENRDKVERARIFQKKETEDRDQNKPWQIEGQPDNAEGEPFEPPQSAANDRIDSVGRRLPPGKR